MATRIYLPSSGNAAVTPAAWLHTPATNNYTYAGVTSKSNSSFANLDNAKGTVSGAARGVVRYVWGPLAGQNIAGNVAALIRALEGNAKANSTVSLGVHLIQANGANRSTLLAVSYSDLASAPYEISAVSIQSRYAYNAAEAQPMALTTRAATEGDYLVVELGFGSLSNNNYVVTLNVGDNDANDFTA